MAADSKEIAADWQSNSDNVAKESEIKNAIERIASAYFLGKGAKDAPGGANIPTTSISSDPAD